MIGIVLDEWFIDFKTIKVYFHSDYPWLVLPRIVNNL